MQFSWWLNIGCFVNVSSSFLTMLVSLTSETLQWQKAASLVSVQGLIQCSWFCTHLMCDVKQQVRLVNNFYPHSRSAGSLPPVNGVSF